ncbi:hypothetical protein BC941DRAFT_420353 [Chlamydoabsidia padenii]|nr:hypothetical protein BC941DRAFT_420353 [Chlamydoabsidia padenii]
MLNRKYFLLIKTLVFSTFFFTPTQGTDARAYQGCGLASNKIYCYGGYTGYEPNTFIYTPSTSDFFYIDLASFDFKNVSASNDYWTPIAPQSNFVLEPNAGLQVASINNKTRLLISGGFGRNNTVLTNSTIIYDPQSKTWTNVPNTLPYYASSGALVDVDDSELFSWGGLINNTGVIVPNQISVLNYGTLQWSSFNVTGNVAYDYTATLAPNGLIYMIGGAQGNSYNTTGYYTSMNFITWFDTKSASWGYDNATGQNVVPRKYHTADLIPGTTKLLIYGGVQNSDSSVMPVSDFAYFYDYQQKAYTPLSLGSSGPGPRSGHSSVLYQSPTTSESYVFILFGYDNNIKLRNDTWVLNVTDVNNPAWLAQSTQGSQGSSQEAPQGKGGNVLSTGAIVGISIGSAVVGFTLTAFALVWFFRKRKQRQEFEIQQMDPRHQSLDISRVPGDSMTEYSSQPMTSLTSDDGSHTAYSQPAKIEIYSDEEAVRNTKTNSVSGPLLGVSKPHGME